MSKKEHKSEFSFTGITWLFYACCVSCLFLLFLCFGGIQIVTSWRSQPDTTRLKTYEEIKSQEGNFQCPSYWRFLFAKTDSHDLHHSRRRLSLPGTEEQIAENRRQVAEGVSRLAENLRVQNESLDPNVVAPLLKIQAMRRHPHQTFELKGLKELEKLDSSDQTHSILERNQELGKPMQTEGEESLSEEELNKVFDEEIEQSLTEQKSSKNSDSAPQIERNTSSSPLEAPSLSPDWPSNGEGKKEEETKFSAPFSDLKSSGDQSEPYNHEKGMEILRRFNQLARNRLESYRREIQDYSCILYKWDQTNVKIDGIDALEMKIREKPYSMYAKSLLPKRNAGREFLYWEGHYNNKLVVFSGPKWNLTLLLDVDSAAVKNSASRSLLQLGFQKLLEELISISSDETNFQNSEIRYYEQAKVGDRPCYALEVTFPQETQDKDFHKIQIFVDEEWTLPIQVIIYDWPQNGSPAKVREFYTYVIQKLNPGFKDQDFCHLFQGYKFKKYIPRLSDEEETFIKSLVPPVVQNSTPK